MRSLRDNLAPFSGMITFAVAFLVVYAATTSVVKSAVVAVPLAIGDFLVVHTVFPANPELREYNLDARRRVKKVLSSVDQISTLAQQVKDQASRKSLLDGCKIIPQLLSQTRQQETTSFKLASTAANVQNYLTSVQGVLEVYLRIQKDPAFFPNSDQQLAAGKQGFADFETFALKAIQQLNSGDTQGYAADLETLKPLSMPTISPSAIQATPAGAGASGANGAGAK